MSKDYRHYTSIKNDIISKICYLYYEADDVTEDKINEVFNFKGNDEDKTNAERISKGYINDDKGNEADKDLIESGTTLSIPLKDMKSEIGYVSPEQVSSKINVLEKPYWTVDVKNWYDKQKNISNIKFGNDELYVKRFNKIYVKIYIRSLRKVIDISKYILQGNIQVGNFGGGFGLTLQPVQGKIVNGQYLIDEITYGGNQFLSKTMISVNNFEEVRHNFYFENVLNAQDLLFIKLDEPFIESTNIDLDTEDDYDMIGLIDRVKTKISQSTEATSINIDIQGRDLSKVFIEDGTHFFPFEYYAEEDQTPEAAYKKFLVNSDDIKDKKILTRIFGKLNDLELAGNRTLKSLLSFIYLRLKTMTLDLTNENGVFGDPNIEKEGIWNFIEFDIEDKVAQRTLANSNIATMSGSLIRFFKDILQEPFIEIVADTIGNKYRFLARTPPMQKKPYEENLTIEISTKYLIDDSTEFGDQSVYSWYLMRPNAMFFGKRELIPIMFPAVFFETYAKIYGSKKFDTSHSYTYYRPVDVDDEQERIDSRIQTVDDFKFLIESHMAEPFLRHGRLIFQNVKNIKRGMNIYIPEIDMLYYVDGYSHNINVSERTTIVNVSRGMRKSLIDLFYGIVDITINEENNTMETVKFNKETFDILMNRSEHVAYKG